MSRLLIVFLLIVSSSALAQIYRWVDEKGRVHYGEHPPEGAKTTTLQGGAGETAPPTVLQRDTSRGPLNAPKGDPAAEAREKKAREDKKLREAKARDERKPECATAREDLAYAERNRLFHEKKGVLQKRTEYTNDEQRDEIHRRRTKVSQSCY